MVVIKETQIQSNLTHFVLTLMLKKGNINDTLKFWLMTAKTTKTTGIILSSLWGPRHALWTVNTFNIIYHNDRDSHKF